MLRKVSNTIATAAGHPGAPSPCPLHRARHSWLGADRDISDPYTAARSPAHAWGFEEDGQDPSVDMESHDKMGKLRPRKLHLASFGFLGRVACSQAGLTCATWLRMAQIPRSLPQPYRGGTPRPALMSHPLVGTIQNTAPARSGTSHTGFWTIPNGLSRNCGFWHAKDPQPLQLGADGRISGRTSHKVYTLKAEAGVWS